MVDGYGSPTEPCLAPEEMAAYLDRRLDGSGRQRAEAHLADCDDCRELLAEVIRTTDAMHGPGEPAAAGDLAGPSGGRASSPRRAWLTASGALAAAALLVLAALAGPRWLDGDGAPQAGDRSALVAAVGTSRTVEARLTGGFAYGPLRSPTRSGVPADNLSLVAAAGVLQKHADEEPSAARLRAFGVAQLLLGRTGEAVRDLEDALAGSPEDATIHSDLAAAYLARAAAGSGLEDFARALDAAERALALDPALHEARFNRALALERSGLTQAAIDAWHDYLSRDPDSGWSGEARSRLSSLQSGSDAGTCLDIRAQAPLRLLQETAGCPQQAREWGDALLGDWARAVLDGDSHAARQHVTSAAALGGALAEQTGDRLLQDGVRRIRERPDLHGALADAHARLEQGRRHYASDERHLALPLFVEARRRFREAGSPYWLWAQHQIATVSTHRRDLDAARALASDVRRIAEARGYHALKARAAWLSGVAALQSSDPAGALVHYDEALRIYRAMGERGNASNVANAAADTHRLLGEFARGWRLLDTALAGLAEVGDPTRRYLAYYNAALYARRENLLFAALHFQDAALEEARTRRGPAGVIEAAINKAAILGALGRHAEAAPLLDEAGRAAAGLSDAQQQAYMAARVTATRGELLMDDDPQQAGDLLAEAARHFTRVEPAEAPRLLLLQGRARRRSGDVTGAARAYLTGIDAFEARLQRLEGRGQRLSYADEGWDLYRESIQLALSEGDRGRALLLSDRARSRAARTAWADGPPAAFAARLGPNQIVVFFLVLERETHAWVFGPSGPDYRRLDITEASLERMTAEAGRLLARRADSPALEALLARLHARILAPLQLPASAREIVIVPDGPLRRLPFASLRDSSGRFLVEHAAVVVASSLRDLAGARPPAAVTGGAATTALVIGAPDIDAARFPDLPPLPHAASEAVAVAALYPTATLLTGAEATRPHVLAGLADADVVHFAGHAVANEAFPERSRLVLASGGDASGELLAGDVRDGGVKPGTIVILSACGTGDGPVRLATGVQSIAHAFLSSGAATVVASLWDVDDRDTSTLMTAFHRALAGGVSPALALRTAQVMFIGKGRPVSSWAAFAAFGGHLGTTVN